MFYVFKDGDEVVCIKLLVQVEDGGLIGQSVDNLFIVECFGINIQVFIFEGESLLIGGMVCDSFMVGVDKVLVFGDIFVLGNLFKIQCKGGQRIECMFFIMFCLVSSWFVVDVLKKVCELFVNLVVFVEVIGSDVGVVLQE